MPWVLILFLGTAAAIFGGERQDFLSAERSFQTGAWEAALDRYNAFLETYPLSSYRGDVEFRRGLLYFHLSRYQRAREQFEMVLRRHPETRYFPLIPYWVGRSSLLLGEGERVRESFQETVDSPQLPEKLRQEALLLLLRSCWEDRLIAEGAALVSRYGKANNSWFVQDPPLLRVSLYILAEQGDWESLIAIFGAVPALSQPRRFPAISYLSARALEKTGSGEEAMALYEELAGGKDRRALISLFRLLSFGVEPERADELIRERQKDFSSLDKDLWSCTVQAAALIIYQSGVPGRARDLLESQGVQGDLLGRIYLEEGRLEEGLALLDVAPDSYLALYRLYLAGETGKVRETLEAKGGERTPREERLLGAVLMRQGLYDQALSVFGEPRKESAVTALDRAKAHFGAGNYSQVLEALSSTTFGSNGDDPAAALYLRALALVGSGRYSEALEVFSAWERRGFTHGTAALMEPYIRFYRGYSLTLVQPPRNEEALTVWTDLRKAYPHHPLMSRLLYRQGALLYGLGRFQEAVALLETLREEQAGETEKNAQALYLLGQALGELGQFQRGEERIREAVTAAAEKGASQAEEFRWGLFRYLREAGELDKALAILDSLSKKEASSAAEALFQRGLIYEARGDFRGAEDIYQIYMSTYPRGERFDAVIDRLTMIRLERGHGVGAWALWERIIEELPESSFRPAALFKSAVYWNQRGEFDRALALLARLEREYPEEARARRADQLIQQISRKKAGEGGREAQLRSQIAQGVDDEASRQAALDLAELLLQEGRGEQEARNLLERVIAQDSAAPLAAAEALILQGQDNYNQGQLVEAGHSFLQAAALGRGDADLRGKALYRALEVLLLVGRRDSAETVLTQLEGSFPGSFWAREARRLWEQRQGGDLP